MDSLALADYIKEAMIMKKAKDYLLRCVKDMEDYKFVMGELSMLRTLREDLKEALHMKETSMSEPQVDTIAQTSIADAYINQKKGS